MVEAKTTSSNNSSSTRMGVMGSVIWSRVDRKQRGCSLNTNVSASPRHSKTAELVIKSACISCGTKKSSEGDLERYKDRIADNAKQLSYIQKTLYNIIL